MNSTRTMTMMMYTMTTWMPICRKIFTTCPMSSQPNVSSTVRQFMSFLPLFFIGFSSSIKHFTFLNIHYVSFVAFQFNWNSYSLANFYKACNYRIKHAHTNKRSRVNIQTWIEKKTSFSGFHWVCSHFWMQPIFFFFSFLYIFSIFAVQFGKIHCKQQSPVTYIEKRFGTHHWAFSFLFYGFFRYLLILFLFI